MTDAQLEAAGAWQVRGRQQIADDYGVTDATALRIFSDESGWDVREVWATKAFPVTDVSEYRRVR